MNVRLVVSPFLALLLSHYAAGQQMSQAIDKIGASALVTANAATAFKQSLMDKIALAEIAVRQAESAHAMNVELSKAYVQLGLWYEDTAQWERSESALEHAVSLLRHTPEPGADLATAIAQLGSLHILMGKLGEVEKEDQEALRLRQNVGNQLEIARSRSDLAVLYMYEKKYAKAKDLAREAEAEFVTNGQAIVMDRIIVRFTLAEALCYLKDCPSAIPLLKAALDEASGTMLPDTFPVGLSNFLLGYAYWKSGDMSGAREYLERGTVLMNAQLGWGHPAYVRALKQYAQFLHEDRQAEAANVVERRIRQVEAVVDVHSIQSAQGMSGFATVH